LAVLDDMQARVKVSFFQWHGACSLYPAREELVKRVFTSARREQMDKARTVVAVAVAVALGVLLPAGAAYAGGQPVQVPNPGTLLLLTSGLAGLAWWLRKGK
jgi:hypothetical protein